MKDTKEDLLKAVDDLKQRIEKYDDLLTIGQAIASIGKLNYNTDKQPKEKEGYVVVPLPNCNAEWTFAAFDWVKRFCDRYPYCFPAHGIWDDSKKFDPRFIYINCDRLNGKPI